MVNNLIGTINLKNVIDYQFIYASQNYGTFYAIYAQFEIDNNYITRINFELINYKGNINLGFNEHDISPAHTEVHESKLHLLLNVKGLSPSRFAHITFSEQNKISLDSFDSIYIYRQLIPLSDSAYKDEVFDSEHYTRSGEGNVSSRNRGSVISAGDFLNSSAFIATGRDCETSIIQIVK